MEKYEDKKNHIRTEMRRNEDAINQMTIKDNYSVKKGLKKTQDKDITFGRTIPRTIYTKVQE